MVVCPNQFPLQYGLVFCSCAIFVTLPRSTIQDCRPEPEWPKEGKVELHNLHIQNDPAAPMVLKDVTCIFPGQKKIGIVDRTGNGKSTLVQALFQVVDPYERCILIDGVDISKIGLQVLRCKLGITLFLGTVRTNLDPLEHHADQELWEVLSKCHLTELVTQDQIEEEIDSDRQPFHGANIVKGYPRMIVN
ncbi:hypothetical protein AAZX31_08G099100 [Glycine max]|uniref:ABC transporter domain-containing protein n=1 Tax=Glycine max TaxID=3847 RepID=K7L5V3_SOYBN|nr:putative ABC transporter C family member 15 [Glycine max]KAG4999792.1 hypothetical protein JHK87_020864 [Glycine soja]KAG5015267.1 hypothetical protein JHK85_021403 [Glycine max]KAG5025062.1 hypothetical protein JHK86_020976 [Glycine max]KAG5136232.1 hypothetical protein JHK82_020963 [Glycine max]KAH1050517.1 hypothetical protein GYH30_020811 [Glycine max]|eukprot:XP_006585101.1 putative ABC transporter C family member 15 [Glycine max]